jgi:uncharacterized SAM-binding protein YcdF (DUF218 family)
VQFKERKNRKLKNLNTVITLAVVKVSKQIFKSVGFVILVILVFLALPYSKQIRIAQIPLKTGGSVSADFGDVIIVPGCGCNPGRGTEERLNLASFLYQLKKRKVILSEGSCFPHERKDFIHRMTKEWKIDLEDIIWDTLSLSTQDNIKNSQILAKEYGCENAIVCTSPFHQMRCGILMFKHWDGEFKIAKMPKELLEMEKEQVYIEQRGRTLKDEYWKSLYEIMFFFSS